MNTTAAAVTPPPPFAMDTINAVAGVAPPPAPVAVRTEAAASMRSPQPKKHSHSKHKKEHNGQHTPRSKRRRNNLKQPLTKDMPRIMSDLLKEPKVALLHRVVKYVGPKMSWQILRETLRLEKDGGQTVNALASGKPELFFVVDEVSHEYKPRRRTSGGVFFTLLKEKVSKEVYRTIYEVEDRKKKDAKKRARNRQRQRMDNTLAKLGFDEMSLTPGGEDPASGDEAGAPVAPVETVTTESESMQLPSDDRRGEPERVTEATRRSEAARTSSRSNSYGAAHHEHPEAGGHRAEAHILAPRAPRRSVARRTAGAIAATRASAVS